VDCDTTDGFTTALGRAVMLGEHDAENNLPRRSYQEILPELKAKTRHGHQRALQAAYSTSHWNRNTVREGRLRELGDALRGEMK
jgi:hypothetical protein